MRRVATLSWIVALLCGAALLGPPSTAQQRGDSVQCVVTVSTATTLTAVTGCTARPGMALSITDINFSTNASAIAADTFNTLKSGTGTNCGTGTAVVWGAFSAAATQASTPQRFVTPLRLPQNTDLCWINSTPGSKFLVITGYYTP